MKITVNNFFMTLCVVMTAIWIFLPSTANALEMHAPHTSENGVTCGDCHSYSLWWQTSPLSDQNQNYDSKIKTMCQKCHGGGGNSILVKNHSSTGIGQDHNPSLGIWSLNCISCHDPHSQPQLGWVGTLLDDKIYLVTGLISDVTSFSSSNGNTTFGYSITEGSASAPLATTQTVDDTYLFTSSELLYEPLAGGSAGSSSSIGGPGTKSKNKSKKPKDSSTTLTTAPLMTSTPTASATSSFVLAEWSAQSTWINKTGTANGKGLIFVVDTANPGETYQIVNANASFITVKGSPDPSTMANKSFGLIYGQMIKKTIYSRDVKFFNPKDPLGGFTNTDTPEVTGICQVCHTMTNVWTQDGGSTTDSPNHLSGSTACNACHFHYSGFGQVDTTKPSSSISPPDGFQQVSSIVVTIQANEDATIHYTIDETTPTPGSSSTMSVASPASLMISTDTIFKYFAEDIAGNQEISPHEANYTFDTIAPVTTASVPSGVYNSGFNVTLGSDESATIYYTIDGTLPTTGSSSGQSPISNIPITEDTSLHYFAKDPVGNVEPTKMQIYKINSAMGSDPDTSQGKSKSVIHYEYDALGRIKSLIRKR